LDFLLRPKVKLVANILGNEPVGRELTLNLAKYILEEANFGDNSRVAKILETTDIYILPSINPDGFVRATEGACSGSSYASGALNEGRKNLNRDFPDEEALLKSKGGRQKVNEKVLPGQTILFILKETGLLMDWIVSIRFVLSASFMDGRVLVTYPYNNYHSSVHPQQYTPDHEEFLMISKAYALNNPQMAQTNESCPTFGSFPDGISNAAEIETVHGSMQDFNYKAARTLEVNIYTSCCKFPLRKVLLNEWDRNRYQLLSTIC